MKKFGFALAALFMMVSVNSFANASEGGGHVEVDAGASYLPYVATSFGYNIDSGKAWIVVEFGESETLGNGTDSFYNSTQREIAVTGLSLNKATREIELNGVPCAKARPYKFLSGADYPVTMYARCSIAARKGRTAENFKGESSNTTTIVLDAQ